MSTRKRKIKIYHKTRHGCMVLGDAKEALVRKIKDKTVDLIVTSPPFGLVRKKQYGNEDADKYIEWFKPFAEEFKRILKDEGSLIIDIGGSWIPGQPTRSLYHYKLLIMLCEEIGFYLAQDFFWWNPSKLPTPAEWVNVRRIRVKDAVNCIWWLSPTPWPKASNKRILQPYSDSMKSLLKNGYKAKLRPSGHDISTKFSKNNKASIPPNLIAVANTESNSHYLRYCNDNNIKPHPARFPSEIPEYFVRMLTDKGDFIIDPFAGSCVTGKVCETLRRKWMCIDLVEDYLKGGMARFEKTTKKNYTYEENKESNYYKIFRPSLLWEQNGDEPLRTDGGKTRSKKQPTKTIALSH